jgi:hypothetical protein
MVKRWWVAVGILKFGGCLEGGENEPQITQIFTDGGIDGRNGDRCWGIGSGSGFGEG